MLPMILVYLSIRCEILGFSDKLLSCFMMNSLCRLSLSSTNFWLTTNYHLVLILLVLSMVCRSKLVILIWSDSSSTNIIVSWSWGFWFWIHVSSRRWVKRNSTFKPLGRSSLFQGFWPHLVHLCCNLLFSLSFWHTLID